MYEMYLGVCKLFLFILLFFGQFNTKYYYVVGIGHTQRQFWFVTPPEVGPDVPYTFGLIGEHSVLNPKKRRSANAC